MAANGNADSVIAAADLLKEKAAAARNVSDPQPDPQVGDTGPISGGAPSAGGSGTVNPDPQTKPSRKRRRKAANTNPEAEEEEMIDMEGDGMEDEVRRSRTTKKTATCTYILASLHAAANNLPYRYEHLLLRWPWR